MADALDWRKLKINGIDVNCTPLQKVIWLEERLTTGFCGPLDASFFDNDRAPKIAFHGRIHPWLGSMYNEPSFNVLEIGSRSVCSDSLWKSHFPRCRYTGFDVLQGKNVNVVGDAHRLSDYFEPRSFDLVISFAVLEHLAMPWVVAEEISKVLKVGVLWQLKLISAFRSTSFLGISFSSTPMRLKSFLIATSDSKPWTREWIIPLLVGSPKMLVGISGEHLLEICTAIQVLFLERKER